MSLDVRLPIESLKACTHPERSDYLVLGDGMGRNGRPVHTEYFLRNVHELPPLIEELDGYLYPARVGVLSIVRLCGLKKHDFNRSVPRQSSVVSAELLGTLVIAKTLHAAKRPIIDAFPHSNVRVKENGTVSFMMAGQHRMGPHRQDALVTPSDAENPWRHIMEARTASSDLSFPVALTGLEAIARSVRQAGEFNELLMSQIGETA